MAQPGIPSTVTWMTRVDEFDAFYSESRRELLHQAYALTGDLSASAAAVEAAYAHAWQHWAKVRRRDPLDYVRPEAWRVALLRHGAHLLRRRHVDGSDTALLEVLGSLSTSSRRLVILQTLAGLDVAAAAREVGMTVEQAVETTDAAVAAMLRRLGGSVAELEDRLHALRRTTDAITLPRASRIRREGQQRQRRNTVAAAIGVVAVIAGSGAVVSAPGAGDAATAAADLPVAGASDNASDERLGATAAQLLPADAVSGLEPSRRWRVVSTASDITRTTPYAPCQDRRFADPRVRDAWVRRFAAPGPGDERLVQAVEVSRTPERAAAAAERMLRWYAGCDEPRTQLVTAHRVVRNGPDDVIVTLRRFSTPVRTLTVALSRSGVVTTALVHTTDGSRGARLGAMGEVMDEARWSVCETSGGTCDASADIRPASLPPSGEAAGFLGVVDLPPVGRLATSWVGTRPRPADPNPSATLCDNSDFAEAGAAGSRSRVYVMPDAERLPEEFGISETVARFGSPARAASSLRDAADKVRGCPDRNLAAEVSGAERLRADGVVAMTWRIAYQINDTRSIDYWLGFARSGADVAQVAFAGADLSAPRFRGLVLRAGQRLAELD